MKWALISFLFLAGCAQVTSLNLRRHQFGMQPSKIIWFQIAGLDEEHLAMLRFGYPTVDNKTVLESSVCVGHAWSFNLYHLRPTPAASFLSQLTGKKDIQDSCTDWKHRPLWNTLTGHGYVSGIIEVDSRGKESLAAARECEDGQNFLGDSTLWLMQASAPANTTPYLPSEELQYKPGVYWDRSCNSRGCGTTLSSALASLYTPFSKRSTKHVFIVRDYSFLHALERKDLVAARDILAEIDRSVGPFMKVAEGKDDMLVIVSGGGAIDLDFPAEGKDWQQFEKSGANAFPRRGELSVPVFAQGARAENFCGMYEESQIFERALSGPKQQGLELKIINPFN